MDEYAIMKKDDQVDARQEFSTSLQCIMDSCLDFITTEATDRVNKISSKDGCGEGIVYFGV